MNECYKFNPHWTISLNDSNFAIPNSFCTWYFNSQDKIRQADEEEAQNFARSKSIILRLVLNLDTEGYTVSLKIRPNIWSKELKTLGHCQN